MLERIKQALGTGPQPASGPVHPTHPGWGEITCGVQTPLGDVVRLRPLAYKDGQQWSVMRQADQTFLEPVEPTVEEDWRQAHTLTAWRSFYYSLKQTADAGFVVPMAIEVNDRFAGQVTLGNIQRGVVAECWIGYWVTSVLHRRGIATIACALGTDHAFTRVGMHRVTATFLPTNEGSRKVLDHCGFREEGYLRENLHINGQWRDHVLVAQVENEYVNGCVDRLILQDRARRV